MRLFALALLTLALLVGDAAQSHSGQIWTDVDADGLPDPSIPYGVGPGSTLTFALFFDAQSFTYSSFSLFVEWTPGTATFVRERYLITDCIFPVDTLSHPNGVGFWGTCFDDGGVHHYVDFTLRIDNPIGCCVTPIIDIDNPYYVFSFLGSPSDYFLFTSNPGTCFESPSGPTEACCFGPFEDCADLRAEDCLSFLGWPQGPGTQCQTVDCPELPNERAACCLPDGSCFDGLTRGECLQRGGVWHRTMACSEVSCTNATHSTSWGAIKALFR